MKVLTGMSFVIFLFASLISAQPKVKTGLEVLKETNYKPLKNKRVGVVTNPTGVDNNLTSIIDLFYQSIDVNLTALYGPEHGVRGSYTAGEYVENYIDPYTNVPVYSLYGKNRKPSPKMLEGVDVLVYDIQDIGVRSYTYISTMGLVMEAAAENGKKFIVLDRPNPLGGNLVEGNIVEDKFISFVSQFKIPYLYGLTSGELAEYINSEILPQKGLKVDLEVIKMEGWKRSMTYDETGLYWVPTSPHIPDADSPFYYAISGIVGELGVVSIGVGYTIPFETFAAPWIDGKKLADEMNKLNLPGVLFRPITYKPYYATYKSEFISGVHIYITDKKIIRPTEIQFYFLQAHHKLHPEKDIFELAADNRISMFDKVAGSNKVRELIKKNYKFEDLKDFFNKDVRAFKIKSKKYYLYD